MTLRDKLIDILGLEISPDGLPEQLLEYDEDGEVITRVDYSEELDQLEQLFEQEMKVTGDTSDGYHTFNELYDYRRTYNAALFNEWAKSKPEYLVHKSWKHSDGEDCFGGGWFIVMAQLPTGQISNHYEAKHWDEFAIPEMSQAAPYDSHTPQQALERLQALTTNTPEEE